jgi:hypothetical protein
MFIKDLLVCLQMTADKCHNSETLSLSCYINPGCGCQNPGKELECENCEHLEACLSRTQAQERQKRLG